MLTPNRVELLGGFIAVGGIAVAQMWTIHGRHGLAR